MDEDLNVRCPRTRGTRERAYDERTPLEAILRSQDFAPAQRSCETVQRVPVEDEKDFACAAS